jgi:hypothetical protein
VRGAKQLDRAQPEFYDYTADEWFMVPVARGRTWLSDPYFDEGGADADIVTVSVPATLDGEVVGVATAELDLAHVVELCAPALDWSLLVFWVTAASANASISGDSGAPASVPTCGWKSVARKNGWPGSSSATAPIPSARAVIGTPARASAASAAADGA